jgi:hypothetical protein
MNTVRGRNIQGAAKCKTDRTYVNGPADSQLITSTICHIYYTFYLLMMGC